MFLSLDRNILIVTDADHTGGVLATDYDDATASTISGGYTKLLWSIFFNDDGDDGAQGSAPAARSSPTLRKTAMLGRKTLQDRLSSARAETAAQRVARTKSRLQADSVLRAGARETKAEESEEGLARVIRATPGLKMVEDINRVSDVVRSEVKQGFMKLGAMQAWRPEGIMWSRTIGDFEVHFVEGVQSLRGHIKFDPKIEIAGFRDIGPTLGATSSGCMACPACATCGACALCAAVNYSAAAVAAAAVTAVANVGSSLRVTPGVGRDDFDINRLRDRKINELTDLQSRIQKMNDALK